MRVEYDNINENTQKYIILKNEVLILLSLFIIIINVIILRVAYIVKNDEIVLSAI